MKEQNVTGGWLTAEYSMLPYSSQIGRPLITDFVEHPARKSRACPERREAESNGDPVALVILSLQDVSPSLDMT